MPAKFIKKGTKLIRRRMTPKENKEFSKKFKELEKKKEAKPSKQQKIDSEKAAERAEMDAFRMAEKEARMQRAFTEPNLKRNPATRRAKSEETKPLKFKNGGIALRGLGKAFMKGKK